MIRDTESIYAVADSLMTQMVEVLSNTITTSEQLTHESSLIPGSTIGKHLRHIHDHFRLLLDALLLNSHSTADITNNNQSKQDDQAVQFSYDIRSRNLPSETIHSAALESFISLGKRIEVETGKGRNLVGNDQIILNAIIPYPVTLETTVAREVRPVVLSGSRNVEYAPLTTDVLCHAN
jgi:hypothetical protein